MARNVASFGASQCDPYSGGEHPVVLPRARLDSECGALHRLGRRDHVLSLWRKEIALRGPIEERNAEGLLQRGDSACHGGVFHTEAAGDLTSILRPSGGHMAHYVVAGVTGRVGSAVAGELLKQGDIFR
jgi:hypothetical protein